ncbi:hypothetical protein HGI30_00755 [Paenibacillus albicereus]|uniref:Uncharacterized protein n=1 Tax=Paenibacillus albicereus TaxID=2726185 RepID=A0A6H2GS70_9BACL|nr:hypothetical protein HGI30_00755 [Paenibacillus albicereus]
MNLEPVLQELGTLGKERLKKMDLGNGHDAPKRTRVLMTNFVYTVGVSYVPLHEQAAQAAQEIGGIEKAPPCG